MDQDPGEFIFNAGEAGLYYCALPNHSFMIKTDKAKGCKASKNTFLYFANMLVD